MGLFLAAAQPFGLFLYLSLLPAGVAVKEKSAQKVENEADAPAKQRPDKPDIATAGERPDDDQPLC
jgi:hypothetical protein